MTENMNLPDSPTLQFLIQNGYWIAVPIMIIEGPIATIIMAFFASFGFFDPFVILFFSFVSDLVSDSIFYAIGYYNGSWFTRKFGKYFRLNERTSTVIQEFFHKHGGKSIFLAKILSGVVPPIFVVAGYSRMSLKKFYIFASIGGLFWSSMMVVLGFFFGSRLEGDFSNVTRLITGTGLVLALILVFLIVYKFYLHKIVEKKWKLVFSNGNNAQVAEMASEERKNKIG